MKIHCHTLLRRLLFLTILVPGILFGQECKPLPHSLLEYLTGDYPSHSPAYYQGLIKGLAEEEPDPSIGFLRTEYLLRAGNPAEALDNLGKYKDLLNGDSSRLQQWNYYMGLSHSANRNFGPAALHFQKSRDLGGNCGEDISKITCQYLISYYQAPNALIFPWFNGGMYNFLKDSLEKGARFSVNDLQRSILVLMRQLEYDGFSSVPHLELLGDLLIKYPDPFRAKWFASIAYLRAARFVEKEADREAFKLKAIYALESDRPNPRTFNRFRFTQLRKAMDAEADSAASEKARFEAIEKGWIASGKDAGEEFNKLFANRLRPAKPENGFFDFTPPNPGNKVLEKIEKDMKALEANKKSPNPNAKMMNPELDLQKIERDVTFNLYAIWVIGFVFAAVIFFWVKISRASRDRNKP